MRRPPFKMLPSRRAALRCDGRFVIGGKASFVWETYLMRRIAGVPGDYEIRSDQDRPWHRLNWSIAEAEEALLADGSFFSRRKVVRAQRTRAIRLSRGLPVG